MFRTSWSLFDNPELFCPTKCSGWPPVRKFTKREQISRKKVLAKMKRNVRYCMESYACGVFDACTMSLTLYALVSDDNALKSEDWSSITHRPIQRDTKIARTKFAEPYPIILNT